MEEEVVLEKEMVKELVLEVEIELKEEMEEAQAVRRKIHGPCSILPQMSC